MKKSIILQAVGLLAVCLMSVPSVSEAKDKDNDKDVVTKVFEPDNFDYIVCNFPCEIKYKEGKSRIVVKTTSKNGDPFNFSVNKGILTMSMKAKTAFVIKDDIEVYSPSLRGVELNGAAKFKSEKNIDAKIFELNINGASKAEIDNLECDRLLLTGNGSSKIEIEGLDCESIDAQLNGTGKFEISGKADEGKFVINGAAKIDISELQIKDVNSQVNGVGKITGHK